ncbi:hypothetical protein [Geoalkalibacter ferrihydriticus]|uniref:hypothetical protein n=1 Tax=Geoalkalibacter ferrihydriticus TaxID=392333 RepID=UPI0011140D95|nr:hypothetical protein [Geoalkalibacter ferrihydriticus]
MNHPKLHTGFARCGQDVKKAAGFMPPAGMASVAPKDPGQRTTKVKIICNGSECTAGYGGIACGKKLTYDSNICRTTQPPHPAVLSDVAAE